MEDWLSALASELTLDERALEKVFRRRRKKWQLRRDPSYRAAPVCGKPFTSVNQEFII